MAGDAIRMDGKVAIITGGAGGIGGATARLMTARGARVAIADIMLDRAEALAGELDGAIAIHLDLESEASTQAMVATTVQHFGRLDVLHNNAGIGGPQGVTGEGASPTTATSAISVSPSASFCRKMPRTPTKRVFSLARRRL